MAVRLYRKIKQQRAARGAAENERKAQIPQGGGVSLDEATLQRLEPIVGGDLSRAKIHTGPESASAAEALDARAFTVGQDIHFGAGEYAPGTKEGDRLLSHELTHTTQAGAHNVRRKSLDENAEHSPDISKPGDADEKAADASGDRAAATHGDGIVSGGAAAKPAVAKSRGSDARNAAAQAYNLKHPDLVEEFNRITGNICSDGEGNVDVSKVREWQAKHGQADDGKVGPHTLAAADAATSSADKGKHENKGAPSGILTILDIERAQEIIRQLTAMLGKAVGGKAGEGGGAKIEATDQEGIASQLSLSTFVGAAKALKARWREMPQNVRAEELGKAVNDELAAAGVLPVKPKMERIGAMEGGKFVPKEWNLLLSSDFFGKLELKDDEAAQFAATAYHEARHAEQSFRIARLLAGQGKTVAEIVAETRTFRPAVEDAAKKPLKEGDPAAKGAKAFYADKFGPGSEHHQQAMREVLAQMQVYVAVKQRVDAATKSGNAEEQRQAAEELKKIRPEIEHAYRQYQELTVESDAFAVEERVKSAMAK
jgi:hypothetical protein